MAAVLLAPEYDPSLAASERPEFASEKTASGGQKPCRGFFGKGRKNAPDFAAQAAGTASGCEASAYKTASGWTHWKVYGPDLNGKYGGMQGTGGLEAVVMDSGGATTGVLNDYFGNGVATISGGSVTWNTTHVGGYGPLPDSAATPLTDATQLAQATVWRGHRIDPTGFYYLGARYYEPTSGRFLSPDPLSFAAGTSLYAFCGGDCVNNFDPDGRGFGDVASAIGSTVFQTFASGVQTIQSGFAHVAGAVIGDSQAGSTVAGQYSSQAMENSVSGQVLNNGGSLAQASAAANILGATLTTAAALPASLAGGEAIMGAYTAGNLSAGGAVFASGALNATLSMAGNAVTQEMATGTINGGQLAFSGVLGLGFGSLSGSYGLFSNYLTQNAANTASNLTTAGVNAEVQAALFAQNGIMDVNPAALANTLNGIDAAASQVTSNAAAQTGAIWAADTFGSPWAQTFTESWLDSQLWPEPSEGNSSGGKHCPGSF